MKITKTILSLIAIYSIVEASSKITIPDMKNDKEIVNVSKKKNRSICSYVKRAMLVSVITLIGYEAFKSHQLDASFQNLSTELKDCVSTCNQSELECYDACAQRMFFPFKFCSDAPGSPLFDSCGKRTRRSYLGQDYKRCKEVSVKNCPNERFNSKECLLAVVKHAETSTPEKGDWLPHFFGHPDAKTSSDCNPTKYRDPSTIEHIVYGPIIRGVAPIAAGILSVIFGL